MKKLVFKLDLIDDKDKRKALKTVSAFSGIDEMSIDIKGKKLTVIGTVDPICVVSKLRKVWPTDIISIGPAKEPEKKEQKKEDGKKGEEKEEAKGNEQKKEESKEEGKKDETNKEDEKTEQAASTVGTMLMYKPHYPPMNTSYYYVNHSMEENPNACVIC